MQLDCESIPKSDTISYNPEDCKRVAQFLSIPMNPWTILQSLCYPFRFVSSISNWSILGITAKTACHRLNNSKLWDANPCHNWHNQYELYHDCNFRQDCKLIGSIAYKLCGLQNNRITSSFWTNSWIKLQSMPISRIPWPITSDPVFFAIIFNCKWILRWLTKLHQNWCKSKVIKRILCQFRNSTAVQFSFAILVRFHDFYIIVEQSTQTNSIAVQRDIIITQSNPSIILNLHAIPVTIAVQEGQGIGN